MSRSDDVGNDMRGSPIDDDATESLLSGAMSPDDAPPGYRDLAVLVRAATPLPGVGAASEAHLVAAFAAEVRGAPRMSAPPAGGRKRSLAAKVISAKFGAAAAVVLIGSGVAAAATGSLPAALQSRVASAASHVGLSIPDPSSKHGGAPANFAGQCNAYSSVSKDYTDFSNPALTNSTAFQRLEAAASGQDQSVQQYCTSTTTSTSTTSTSTSTTSTTSTTTTTTTTSSVPSSTSTTLPANTFGQCNAYSSVSKGFTDFSSPALTKSTAFRRLAALAAAQSESVEQYCAPVLGLPSTTTTSTSTTTTTTVPGSHGKGGGHGKGGNGKGGGSGGHGGDH